METNRILAADSRSIAQDMGSLTWKTVKLSEKTKQETVSMRIITLVTLAFLPGTFISVGLSVSLATKMITIADLFSRR